MPIVLSDLALAALIGVLAIFFYRRFFHSKKFTKVVDDIVHPADTDEQVVDQLDTVHRKADKFVEETDQEVLRRQQAAERVRRTRSAPPH